MTYDVVCGKNPDVPYLMAVPLARENNMWVLLQGTWQSRATSREDFYMKFSLFSPDFFFYWSRLVPSLYYTTIIVQDFSLQRITFKSLKLERPLSLLFENNVTFKCTVVCKMHWWHHSKLTKSQKRPLDQNKVFSVHKNTLKILSFLYPSGNWNKIQFDHKQSVPY